MMASVAVMRPEDSTGMARTHCFEEGLEPRKTLVDRSTCRAVSFFEIVSAKVALCPVTHYKKSNFMVLIREKCSSQPYAIADSPLRLTSGTSIHCYPWSRKFHPLHLSESSILGCTTPMFSK